MNILIDIGHPGHVHLFRNLVSLLQSNGHRVMITARDKEVTHALLNEYGIPYIDRGKGFSGLAGKIFGSLFITLNIVRIARTFKPDLLLGGVGNIYIALAGFLLRKPSIICDDTEHASMELSVIKRFATHILTPDVYTMDIGAKQIRYPSYHEWAYLNPAYFRHDGTAHQILNLTPDQKFVLIRFVSWEAGHDVGSRGLNAEEKVRLVEEILPLARPFISAEGDLPQELKHYQLAIKPTQLHQVLAGASLFIGEGATTASEAVCLGVPAIYINPLKVGYCTDQAKNGLLFQLTSTEEILDKTKHILNSQSFLKEFSIAHQQLFDRKIDFTAFLYQFVTGYPASVKNAKQSYTNAAPNDLN